MTVTGIPRQISSDWTLREIITTSSEMYASSHVIDVGEEVEDSFCSVESMNNNPNPASNENFADAHDLVLREIFSYLMQDNIRVVLPRKKFLEFMRMEDALALTCKQWLYVVRTSPKYGALVRRKRLIKSNKTETPRQTYARYKKINQKNWELLRVENLPPERAVYRAPGPTIEQRIARVNNRHAMICLATATSICYILGISLCVAGGILFKSSNECDPNDGACIELRTRGIGLLVFGVLSVVFTCPLVCCGACTCICLNCVELNLMGD